MDWQGELAQSMAEAARQDLAREAQAQAVQRERLRLKRIAQWKAAFPRQEPPWPSAAPADSPPESGDATNLPNHERNPLETNIPKTP